MTRINIYDEIDQYTGERAMLGWFDPDKATDYQQGTKWDGNNNVSLATGSQWVDAVLYRTPAGRWVEGTYPRIDGRTDSYRYLTDDEAYEWLIRNDYTAAEVEQATQREVPEERSTRGVLSDDAVSYKLLIPADLLAAVDAKAAAAGVSRAEYVRQVLAEATA